MTLWQLASQIAIGLLTAVVSFIAARAGVREANRRGGREEWWRRFTWAVDRRSSDDPLLQMAGNTLLHNLFESPLAGDEERKVLLDAMWLATVGSRPVDPKSGPSWTPWDLRAETAQWLLHADPEVASASPVLRLLARRGETSQYLSKVCTVLVEYLRAMCELVRSPDDPELIVAYVDSRGDFDVINTEALLTELLPNERVCLSLVGKWPVRPSGKTDRAALIPANFPPRPEIRNQQTL